MPQVQRPGAGDFTGQEKQRAAREQAAVVADRKDEISMATAVEMEEETFGVFDPNTGERLNEPNPSSVAYAAEEEEPPAPRFGGNQDREPVFSGKEPVEAQVVPPSTRRFPKPFDVARSAFVTIRLDQDVENMTYGMLNGEPNNFNFKEGLAYRVSREIADHLAERGLVRQMMEVG